MNNPNHITISDKFLAATFLKLLPQRVTPNQVTISRFFMTPFVVLLIFLEYYTIGVILFIIAAFTDALDGALARTRNQVTEWGALYDPFADKLLIGLTALIIIPKFLNPAIVFLIILIEATLIGSSYYRRSRGTPHVQANGWGKSKMILQSIGVGLLLLFTVVNFPWMLVVAEFALYGSILLGIGSLLSYSS